MALVSGGNLQMNGTIESVGTMDARSGDELTVGGTVKTKGTAVTIESKKKLTLSGIVESKGGAVQLNATDDDLHMSGSIASAGGAVTIKTEDNLYIEGSADKKASITSGGGNIKILVDSDDADLQAKPGEVPPDGMISIKEAYIDSSSTEKDSGNIAIQADRDVMGISRIDIDGATINAGGANGKNAGNVTISATATTNLHAWDIGDGAYALINIGKKENNPSETEKKSNTIIGDNVSIAAIASTTGETGDNKNITDEEIQSKINGLDSSFADLAANLRFALSATKIASEAKINVYDADIQAVGGNKGGTTDDSGKTVPHGNLSIVSDAKSKIAPITGNIVGYGVNVGISDVTSTINIDRSDLYSHGDTAIKAAGDNRVELTYIELALLDSYVRSTMNMSWAELSSNVEANVGEKAVITSGNDVDISAKSVRSLSSSVSNGSDRNVIGIAASVAIADTNANASMAGTVYAGGDVSVKADNTVAEEDGVYKADTSKAASMSGDSALKPIVNTAMDGGKSLWSWVKGKFGKVSEKVADVADESKPWNKVGVNASTALLFSENDATASVTGKVRGVEMTDGKVVGKDKLGAKSLSVDAHNLSRTNVRVSSYQQDLTEFNKPDKPSERKETGVAAAIGYASQNNAAEAYIGGDVKVQNDVDVTAKIEIPWQTKLQGTGTTALMNAVFQAIDSNPILPDLVDMWAQSSGGGEDTSAAVSVSVMNYDNSAKAYIGKKNETDAGTVKVEAGGDVTIDAKSDITTVNFSGNIKNPLKSSIINAPVGFYTGDFNVLNNYIGKDGQAANTIGGSVLYVGQDNTVDAYIGDGADVKAGGDVKVTANAEAWNLAMAASGGLAGSLGLNGTISVNRIVNNTNAYIGKADVTANGDVLVEAADDSTDLNIGGVVSVSGGDGVGATIAYNEINRNTTAYSQGHITAGGNADVNALNTGEIYALSAAGSVAYTEKKLDGTEIEGSGESIGGDSDSASDISNWIPGLAGEDFSLDPDDWISEGMDNIQSAGETVSGVMDEGQEAVDMTETAKNSFAAAANVSVNRIKDHAKAYIAGTNGDASVTAGALRVTTLNDSVIYAANATMALNFATGGDNNKSLAGSFMWNSITAENDAYVDGATLSLSGDTRKDDKGNEIDQALVVEAINDESILNIAASGAGTRKGSAYAGQVSVNWVDTANNAYVKNSTVKADEAVTIHAENGENIDSYTGAVAIAGGTSGSAVGASVAVNLVDGKTNAYFVDSSMEGTEDGARGGKLSVNAEDTSEITSIVASGSANLGGGKFAGAFSGNGNDVGITTNAYVDTTKAIKAEHINIEAANKSIATIGTGGVAASVGGGSAAGGSVGVMLNDSSVSAYMKGDGTKTNAIDANAITINAKNLYNGSAKDSEEDETARNVAVGGAVSTGKFAFAGSITVNKIDQNTDAYLGAGKYNVNAGKVDIDAYTVSNLFGMAGGLAVGKTAAVGAAIDTQIYSGHTYASIEDGADVANADDVSVDAVSEEHMTSVAAMGAVTVNPGQEAVSFSGAGAAGAHKISTDTKAYIGNKEDKTVSKENAAKLSDVGTVTVNAKDTTKLGTGAGSAAVAASISGAGVGLSAAVEVVNKNVGAFVGNNTSISAGGLSVTAENTSDSTTAAAGLGAGGAAGIAGSASETIVNHTTKAYVGESASVTVNDEALVKATSGFTQGAGAGSVGAGAAAGIGLANTTVKLTADTNAYVGNKASVTGGIVKIAADHTTDITYATVAGGLSSTVGVSGAVGVNYLDTTTHATIGESADVIATETSGDGIELTAEDKTTLNGGTGGAAAGLGGAGAGAAVTVNHIKKNTEASVGKNASLLSKGKVKLDAKNTENILNATVQASGGLYAGLAGAVTVTDIYDITKAYTDTGVRINQEEDYKESGGDITVNAEHAIEKLDSIVAGAAGGGVSIGAAVDVATIKTLTNAYIGDGNQVNTQGALSVTANDKMENIRSVPVSASIGTVGLAGSFSIYSFSNDVDKSDLNGNVSEEGGTKTFDDWINEQMNQSGKDVGTALGAYGGGVMDEIQNSLPEDFSSAPTTASEIGTSAKIGNSSIIQAKSVTVDAKDKIDMTTGMGNLAAGVAGAGASVAILNSDTQVQAVIDKSARISTAGLLKVNAEANHTLNTTIVGAAVGGVAIQGTVQTWNDETNVYAKVGTDETDEAIQIEAGSIEVKADNDRTLRGTITGASAALLGAASGSVITADIGGESIASIGKVNMAATDGDVTIASTADTDLDATAVAAAVGYYSGAGTGAALSSHVNTESAIASGASLSGGNLSITSINTPKLSATAGAAAGGMAAVGATVAKVESKDNASVTVGDNVSFKAKDKVTIKAETARPEGEDNLYAKAIAGSGGVIAGAVSTTDVILNQDTSVTIGKNNTIKAGKLDILAKHEDATNFRNESVAAGGVSGTGAETNTDINSTVKVSIGDNTRITTKEETAVKAENITEKGQAGESNVFSGGASLANGNGIVNTTDITHTTKADIGKVTISASAVLSKEEEAEMSIRDKNAVSIDAHSSITSNDDFEIATGAAVGAAHIENTTKAGATTTVTVADGSVFRAGDTDAANGKDSHTMTEADNSSGYTFTKDVGGGSIAVGSRNDADIRGTTLVDVWGAAGYAGSENNVTYTGTTNTTFGGDAETAKGDIRIAAGRDSAGTAGTIRSYAHTDILNYTVIPISIKKDPYAVVNSDAKLTLTGSGNLRSDRDVYLQSTAGNVNATGNGEVKDWVNALADAFGSDGSKLGKDDTHTSADAELNGSAQTGIHRKIDVTVTGNDNAEKGTWVTTVTQTGDVSYIFSPEVGVGESLSERLEALKKLKKEYSADPAAVAAYEAEIVFLQAKMVEQGLGYYEDGDTSKFIQLDLGKTTELASGQIILQQMVAAKDGALELLTKGADDLETQKSSMEAIGTTWTAWDTANGEATKAKTAMDQAQSAFTAAESAAKQAATDASMSLEQYLTSEQADPDIVGAYNEKKVALSKAETSYNEKAGAAALAEEAYRNQVKGHNDSYETGYDADALDRETMQNDWDTLTSDISNIADAKNKVETDVKNQQGQVSATERFQEAGGTDVDGKFYLNGNVVTQYTAEDGKTYDLLHFSDYGQKTHNVTIGDITAQVGNIYLEGDNAYGTGSLAASGDASVHIRNETPNNLIVGDVKVIHKEEKMTLVENNKTSQVNSITQGGQIYFNNETVSGSDAIKEKNKDKDKIVGFTKVEDRNTTDAPTVVIENTFNPQEHLYEDGDFKRTPYYAAPELRLKGTVYNTRGAVNVTSKAGDVYNEGSIQAGSVSLTASSGDFIQSFSGKTLDKQIANIGGVPNESGTVEENSGILANGNIFISARYVNVNSKIQSGIAEYKLTINDNFTLSYKDDSGATQTKTLAEVNALSAEEKGKWTFTVNGAEGNAADNLRYDAVNERFVLDGVEVKGGKVQIVGTIMNTSSKTDGSVGRIEALDGYGGVEITNNSAVPIELKTVNTGSGVKGVIEITDLELGSGKITRKTTYTRDENGQIQMAVEMYEDGKATGKTDTTSFGKGEDGVYKPAEGLYYQWQQGETISSTLKYHLTTTKVDWWGIEDENPTEQDIINAGGKVTEIIPGGLADLPAGTLVTKADEKDWINTDNYYSATTNTYTVDSKVTDKNVKTKRLWYTLGLAKKYDIDMTVSKLQSEIHSHAVKASQDIGIAFNGSQSGGTIKVTGNADVIIGGAVSNVGGTTEISTSQNIVQGAGGYLTADTLTLHAGGDAGTKEGVLQTNANTLSGTAGGSLYVSMDNHGVSLGNITAGGTASITAGNGITQKDGALIQAKRVELDAGSGAISGSYSGDGIENAVRIQTGNPETAKDMASAADYGLKAKAYGDISIYNDSNDLYLDSVSSTAGDVSLVTKGSFIDNNYTDTEDEDAKTKLESWAKAAVLEGAEATVEKQKTMLISKVEGKYNRYQLLSANVQDGTFTLSDSDRKTLASAGVDVEAYIADCQKEYDSLKNAGVGSWTKADVETYVNEINTSKDQTMFGNASLTKDQLTASKFLTVDEQAEILIGSAKSAKDLLVTFSAGGIKDGITDTNTSYKETPHVTGNNVMMKALGTNGEKSTGNIGQKLEGIKIDLSDPYNLTAAELLALSTAERGDFKVDGDTVTVSSVQAIYANASGTMKAYADKGAIYISSESAFKAGSELFADDELRLKVSDDLEGISVGSNDQLILESGEGAIKNVTVTGTGVLTARAKDGVEITKGDDEDLVINAVYASEGDVDLTVREGKSILADKENNTTGLHVQGQNIAFHNAGNIGTGDAALGVKVTGTETVSGKVDAMASGDVHMILNGTIENDSGTVITGQNVGINNLGNIHGGTYEGTASFSLTNGLMIDGGTFRTNGQMDVTNAEGGTFAKAGDGTAAEVSGSAVTIRNEGTISGGVFTATEEDLSYTAAKDAVTSGGTLISDNADVNITANGGDVTFDKIQAENGSANISEVGNLSITDVHVGGRYDVVTIGDAVFETVKAGAVTITAGGSVTGTSLTTEANEDLEADGSAAVTANGGSVTIATSDIDKDYKVSAKTDVGLTSITSGGSTMITAGGNVVNSTLDAGSSVTVEAGGALTSGSIKANENVTLNSKDDMKITDLEAGKAASLKSGEGNVDLMTSEIGDALKVTAKGNITVTTTDSVSLNMNAGGSILATGEGAMISSGDIKLTAGKDITISDRDGGVRKLEGVDTDGKPGNVTGVGTAAPLVNGESAGNPFDTSTTGSAVISSSTGKITMEAGETVSADHVVLGKEGTVLNEGGRLNINANVVGIDSLESHGTDKVTVTVKGNDKPAYHVGIHSGTDASVTVKDSYIQHLDLTGKDNIGIENTAISGNSRLETDKIFVDIRDNPGNSEAQGFGHITLSGYDISSGGHFTDIHDGITINGATRPVTAMSVMNRSLYGLDYAGKDAEERAREESTDANVEILFAEVMSYEKYHSIRM